MGRFREVRGGIRQRVHRTNTAADAGANDTSADAGGVGDGLGGTLRSEVNNSQ